MSSLTLLHDVSHADQPFPQMHSFLPDLFLFVKSWYLKGMASLAQTHEGDLDTIIPGFSHSHQAPFLADGSK